MARPRTVLLAAVILLALWAAALVVACRFQATAIRTRVARGALSVGLVGPGATMLERSARDHLARAARAGSEDEKRAGQEQYASLMAEALRAVAQTRGPSAAETLAAQALTQVPASDELVAARARCLRLANRSREASKLLEGFLRQHRGAAPHAHHQLALILEQAGKYQAAEQHWQASLAADPSLFEPHFALSHLYRTGLKHPEQALAQAQEALQRARTPSEVRQALAAVQAAGGRAPLAVTALARAALHRSRGLAAFLAFLLLALFRPALTRVATRPFPVATARLLLRLNKRDPACLAVYQRALEARPDDIGLRHAIADVEWGVRRGSERATAMYQDLWRRNPQDLVALERFVEARLTGGPTDEETVSAFTQWFQHCTDPQRLGEIAAILARVHLGQEAQVPESALPVLQTALQGDPGNARLQKLLGALNHHYGHNEEAIRCLAPFATGAQRDPAAVLTLGKALVGANQFYLAYRHLRGLPASDDTTSALYAAGVGCDQQGQHRLARRILQEVAAREPGFADVQPRLAALGDLTEETTWGPYRLDRPLADLETYRLVWATDPDQEPVLLAIFRHEFSDALEFPTLLASHVEALRQVQHDSLVPIVGCESADETYYVVHRLRSATSLGELLHERGYVTSLEGFTLAAELLRSLSAAHSAGFLHGDLGPDGVLIRPDRYLNVVGFGYAAVAYAASPRERQAAVGSFCYVSPEFVRKEPLDTASDIYSAGCLLYHLLVGRPPFQASSRLATMMEHVTATPELPSHAQKSLYPDVDAVVMRALQKERGQRYATAEEFRQAVLACAGLPPGRLRVELRAPTEGGGPAASEGQWWQSYDHVELIRAARFARVFRGVDRTEREARCIKELSIPEFGAALDTRARSLLVGNLTRLFQNEIHLLAHLGSNVRRPEGVVQIYQIWPGDADHPAAYSMELLERTLEDHLRAQGPLSLLDALSLGLRLAQRVAELHTTGTVHRNLTPSSIMFSREGEICLVGFDRACRMMDHDALLAAEAALQAVVTIPTHALGHPAYLSPEQCRTEPFDQRTDIYSLGCVIYRLIAGRPPFVNDDPVALMLSHLAEMPRALADLAERVPSQLDDLFARVLAKHPEDRLPSAQEFAGQLQKITDRVGRAR